MNIRRIGYAEILDAANAGALLREYGEECSIPEIGTPAPQRETYDRMEASGLMHSFGLFDGSDLAGFATLLLFVLPHYGKKIANVESIFIGASHRRGGAGNNLMAHIEAFAKEMQCVVVLYNARAGSRLEKYLRLSPRYKRTNSVFLWSVA